MLKTLIFLVLLAAPSPSDAFKKEMDPLAQVVDSAVNSTGAHLTLRSRASLVDGYGVVVTAEVAFDTPQVMTPFGALGGNSDGKTVVAQRRKDLQAKISALVADRVTKLESVGADDSLTIVIHVLNTNPASYPTLPTQMQFSSKKQAPSPATFREF